MHKIRKFIEDPVNTTRNEVTRIGTDVADAGKKIVGHAQDGTMRLARHLQAANQRMTEHLERVKKGKALLTLDDVMQEAVRARENIVKTGEKALNDIVRESFNALLGGDYISYLRGQASDKWKTLSETMILSLQPYYSIDLRSVKYAQGINTRHGMSITVQNEIFFTDSIDPENKENDLHILLHELEHVVQYHVLGFAAFMARYASSAVIEMIKKGSFNIHDNVEIEKEAEDKANRIFSEVWAELQKLLGKDTHNFNCIEGGGNMKELLSEYRKRVIILRNTIATSGDIKKATTELSRVMPGMKGELLKAMDQSSKKLGDQLSQFGQELTRSTQQLDSTMRAQTQVIIETTKDLVQDLQDDIQETFSQTRELLSEAKSLILQTHEEQKQLMHDYYDQLETHLLQMEIKAQERFDQVDMKLANMTRHIDSRFDRVDDSLQQLNEQLTSGFSFITTQMNINFSELSDQVSELQKQSAAHQTQIMWMFAEVLQQDYFRKEEIAKRAATEQISKEVQRGCFVEFKLTATKTAGLLAVAGLEFPQMFSHVDDLNVENYINAPSLRALLPQGLSVACNPKIWLAAAQQYLRLAYNLPFKDLNRETTLADLAAIIQAGVATQAVLRHLSSSVVWLQFFKLYRETIEQLVKAIEQTLWPESSEARQQIQQAILEMLMSKHFMVSPDQKLRQDLIKIDAAESEHYILQAIVLNHSYIHDNKHSLRLRLSRAETLEMIGEVDLPSYHYRSEYTLITPIEQNWSPRQFLLTSSQLHLSNQCQVFPVELTDYLIVPYIGADWHNFSIDIYEKTSRIYITSFPHSHGGIFMQALPDNQLVITGGSKQHESQPYFALRIFNISHKGAVCSKEGIFNARSPHGYDDGTKFLLLTHPNEFITGSHDLSGDFTVFHAYLLIWAVGTANITAKKQYLSEYAEPLCAQILTSTNSLFVGFGEGRDDSHFRVVEYEYGTFNRRKIMHGMHNSGIRSLLVQTDKIFSASWGGEGKIMIHNSSSGHILCVIEKTADHLSFLDVVANKKLLQDLLLNKFQQTLSGFLEYHIIQARKRAANVFDNQDSVSRQLLSDYFSHENFDATRPQLNKSLRDKLDQPALKTALEALDKHYQVFQVCFSLAFREYLSDENFKTLHQKLFNSHHFRAHIANDSSPFVYLWLLTTLQERLTQFEQHVLKMTLLCQKCDEPHCHYPVVEETLQSLRALENRFKDQGARPAAGLEQEDVSSPAMETATFNRALRKLRSSIFKEVNTIIMHDPLHVGDSSRPAWRS